MATGPKIGVVGLGRMGANMARRLKDVGDVVAVVYDTAPETAAKVASEVGAQASSTLAGVTAAADLIITVVPDDAAMRRIFAETGDSLLTGAKGKLFVNCATITPDVHVEVEKLVEARGGQSLEACMA